MAPLSQAVSNPILEPIAWRVLETYDLDVSGLELVAHALNVTFKLYGTEGDLYALRLYAPGSARTTRSRAS